MNHFMVECPVCGKWLKHFFALNGHMRLKGDELHRIYFETHKIQNPKKESTDLENQVKDLISVVKQKMENTEKDPTDVKNQVWEFIDLFKKQNENLNEKYNNTLLKITELVELFSNIYDQLIKQIKQKEVKVEKPVIKSEKTDIKVEKTLTVVEFLNKYGSIENAVEFMGFYPVADIIDKDRTLDMRKHRELKNIAREAW